MNEDFPLDYYPGEDGITQFFSRSATYAMRDYDIFDGSWPEIIGTPEEADEYWSIRESVQMYDDAVMNSNEKFEAMILANVKDHVQTIPDKPHVRQAYEGWTEASVKWVQINPSPQYIIEAMPKLKNRTDLPDMYPNTPPNNWSDADSYCVPEDIESAIYQQAAVWQMADRAQKDIFAKPTN